MLNPLEIYRESGRKARLARKHHDEACARFHSEWVRRAKALESPEDRAKAQDAFNEGYREG